MRRLLSLEAEFEANNGGFEDDGVADIKGEERGFVCFFLDEETAPHCCDKWTELLVVEGGGGGCMLFVGFGFGF